VLSRSRREKGPRLTVDEVVDLVSVGGEGLDRRALPGIDPTLVRAVGRRAGQLFVVLDTDALLTHSVFLGRMCEPHCPRLRRRIFMRTDQRHPAQAGFEVVGEAETAPRRSRSTAAQADLVTMIS